MKIRCKSKNKKCKKITQSYELCKKKKDFLASPVILELRIPFRDKEG